MDRIRFSKRIRDCRKQHKMTQRELADRLGVSFAFVSLIEHGESSIGLENFVELCNALKVTPDSLLCDGLVITENKPPNFASHVNYVRLGEKIRQRRIEMKISQVELAEQLKLSKSFLSHIEHGRGQISLESLVELSNILEVSLDFLLSGSPEK